MMSDTHHRDGFTLAEAMIAMVILAVAAAAVVLPFSAGAAAHTEGAKQTIAAQLAAELLEKLKDEPFDTLELLYDGYTEWQGTMVDAEGQVYSDPIYSQFWRRSTCAPLSEFGQSWWVLTAYVYYDQVEVLHISTLVGP